MHGHEKSDRPVVPASPPDKAGQPAAEAGEGSGLGKENAASATRPGLRAGVSVPSALDRVRRVARQDKDARFTALLHHVDVDRLRAAYFALRPKAAPGVDGVTWQDYGEDLEANLRDLHDRVHRGAYRARPSRRVYIPKADGRQRPLAVLGYWDFDIDLEFSGRLYGDEGQIVAGQAAAGSRAAARRRVTSLSMTRRAARSGGGAWGWSPAMSGRRRRSCTLV